ncbi:MAG: ABC transporter ATP-binding protein [Planctomycetota bacterium]|nr:ABC transporter ATP-binding protein [Planctomycetota bacterium]
MEREQAQSAGLSIRDADVGPGAEPLLAVRDLRVYFRLAIGARGGRSGGAAPEAGVARAVDGVDLDLDRGECVALVGESGCGKTATALAILRLLPAGRSADVRGRILLAGRDLLSLPEGAMRRVRGREISMVFQEPQSALNPVFTVGEQVAESLLAHGMAGRAGARHLAVEALRAVGMPDPERMAESYPHELSGGMKQRALIAAAIATSPAVLIADEPTTALDVTVQSQILDLLDRLRRERGLALLLITHDLGAVADMASRVYVMYAGKVVERCHASDLASGNVLHPYTQGLLRARPVLGATAGNAGGDRGRRRLAAIPGSVPSAAAMPAGCRFAPRCPWADRVCAGEEPPLREVAPGRAVACCHASPDRGNAWTGQGCQDAASCAGTGA